MANNNPIFSKQGDIQGGDILGWSANATTAPGDYLGTASNNTVVFASDTTNGGFVQRLRFKAVGTQVATVARVYINNGNSRLAGTAPAITSAPTGEPRLTGGSLVPGTGYFAKIVAVDTYGGFSVPSAESANVVIASGNTGSILWSWPAQPAATSYRVYVGPSSGNQITYFTVTGNTGNPTGFLQTTPVGSRDKLAATLTNNMFYGEVSLPAVTAINTAATTEVDYPMNIALPPAGRIVVGLGGNSNVTANYGWSVTGIGGAY